IYSYTLTATTPHKAGDGWSETVTAINTLGDVSIDDSSTVVTLSSTSGTTKFYTDNTYTIENADKQYTLSGGVSNIYLMDTASATFTLTALDANSKTGTSAEILVDAGLPSGTANAPEYASDLTFEVPFTLTDEGGSGVRDAELFYTTNSSAPYTWTKFGETFTSSPVTFTASAEGTYGFRLIAYDNVGNSDEVSPPVESTAPESSTVVDVTAPAGSITAPLNNTFAPALPPQFTASATDEISGVGSVEFQYKLSSASEYTTISTVTEDPYAANWGETVLANGSSYDLKVIVTDKAGNTYTSEAVRITCDAIAPTGSITAPLNNSYADSVPPAFSATASDDASGIASVNFQYKLSTSTDYTDLNTVTNAPYTSDWGAETFTDGSIYNLKVIITDAAGNTYSPDAVAVTCDTVEPTGSISAPLDNGRVNSVTPVFTVSAEDSASGVASVKFQYKLSTNADYTDLNTATEAPYTAAWGAVTLSDNSIYNLSAVITDRAGKSFTVTPITITCDITANPAPSAVHIKAGADNTIDYISNLSQAAVSVDVSFAAAPEAGTVYVELSDGAITVSGTADANTAGTVTTVSGIDASTLADGAITVKAKHTDTAGNETSLVSGTAGMKDTVAANFTISYYTNAACTSAFSGDYLKAGTYYMKIAANKSLSVAPTVTITSEGTANDVTAGAVTLLSGNDYVYTRTIVSDVLAIGAAAERVYISATDSAGNVVTDLEVSGGKYTDTTAPAVAISIANDYYTSSDWVAASTINGSFTDTAGLLATSGLRISIMRQDGATNHYWNGSNWDSTSQQWNNASFADGAWAYNMDKINLTSGRRYVVTAQAEDVAGNVTTSSTDSFLYEPILKISRASGSGDVTAGGTIELAITAVDYLGNTVSAYSGNKSLVFSGPAAAPNGTLPTVEGVAVGVATPVSFTSGVSAVNTATLRTYLVGSFSLDVQDAQYPSINSEASEDYQLSVVVIPASYDHFKVSGPSEVAAGANSQMTVTAYDLYDNIASAYSGSRNLT
ncbi:MAG: Ig-like domain-containing protein, partial [Candidatus Paceibacterota bacterium]